MMDAIAIYRDTFRPSARLAEPYIMLGLNVFAADTNDEATLLATSMQQAFVNLRSGRPGKLKPPFPGYMDAVGPQERVMLDNVPSCSAIGSAATVERQMQAFLTRTGVNEPMIASQIFDRAARLRSYEIVAGFLHKERCGC